MQFLLGPFKKMNQKQIWDKVDFQWHNFRQKPTEEVMWFLDKYCKNKGKVLDWKNTNIYKWSPYKYFSTGGWGVDSSFWYSVLLYPTGFYFETEEKSNKAIPVTEFWDFMLFTRPISFI